MKEGTEYPCHGYNTALPNGKASGVLIINPTRFDFSVGGQRGFIPFEGAEIKLGGASDRLVFISHPAVAAWKLYTSDLKILKHPQLRELPAFKHQLNKAKNKRLLNWSILAVVTTLIIALPLFAVLRMDLLAEWVAAEIPPQWERQLGESSMAQYRESHDFLDAQHGSEILQPLLAPLLAAVHQDSTARHYEYQFFIVNDSSLNAFALPGGWVVVHSGLILQASNAEELLGVLAHEIIHVQEQHGLRNIIRTLGFYLTLSAVLGDIEGLLGGLAGAAPLLLNQSYTRDFERQADSLGYSLLLKAGIDPGGLATFFERMKAQEESKLAAIGDESTRAVLQDTMGFLSTHPATQERIAYLKALNGEVAGESINLAHHFDRLRKSVKLYMTRSTSEENTQ